MDLPGLPDLEKAAELVYSAMPETPQISWPLLNQRTGAEVWVKHENHTPLGAFKVRGGLVYFDRLKREQPNLRGVVAATRGNHGQSVAFAAKRNGLGALIVVPHGNSREKNAAMRALGAELVEQGDDFQAAFEHAVKLAGERELHLVPSFHRDLVAGVATGYLELLRAVPALRVVYVPIGMGSGICAAIAARDALGLKTEIVGVCAASAPAYAESFAGGKPVTVAVTPTIADGMACRTPIPEALGIIRAGAARVVVVGEEEIRSAMRDLFTDTHNVAEGAGAAALAALMQERSHSGGQRVAIMVTGGNVDREVFARVLTEV
ncbi:MAG: hypothetical protein JWM88_125 [Verrucomicrobia bacterium]|nr:hypothetical protein [Verrucomicrobiota bacterium]